jgi:hypothetical protein
MILFLDLIHVLLLLYHYEYQLKMVMSIRFDLLIDDKKFQLKMINNYPQKLYLNEIYFNQSTNTEGSYRTCHNQG